jgi:hypothetical protein
MMDFIRFYFVRYGPSITMAVPPAAFLLAIYSSLRRSPFSHMTSLRDTSLCLSMSTPRIK